MSLGNLVCFQSECEKHNINAGKSRCYLLESFRDTLSCDILIKELKSQCDKSVVNCVDCLYYNESVDVGLEGYCKRKAPVIQSIGGTYALWPVVMQNEFCGEGRKKI